MYQTISGAGNYVWCVSLYYHAVTDAGWRQNMEITIIFKIALVGILVTILNQILKQSGRDEQAFIVSLAGLILVLFWVIPYISELFEVVQDLFSF